MHKNTKAIAREKRHTRVRKKISGLKETPRLSVFRSISHIYAQLVDDVDGKTLVSASTLNSEIKKELKTTKNIDAAKLVGKLLAQKAVGLGIQKVAFDKGGYKYHGRVKALADSARENGLKF